MMHAAPHFPVSARSPTAGLAGQAMRAVEVPIYDFTRHQRSAETRRVEPADVVILEVRRRTSAHPACGASAAKTS